MGHKYLDARVLGISNSCELICLGAWLVSAIQYLGSCVTESINITLVMVANGFTVAHLFS